MEKRKTQPNRLWFETFITNLRSIFYILFMYYTISMHILFVSY